MNIPNRNVLSYGNNHKIFDTSYGNNPEYVYEIYDTLGEITKREVVRRGAPTITYLSDSLLSIEIGAGTSLWHTQYYDIKNSLFSATFESPVATQNNKVVYVLIIEAVPVLVIRDIWDESKYYKEFYLEFSHVANPANVLCEVKFISDVELEISYLAGEEYVKKTEVIYLDD